MFLVLNRKEALHHSVITYHMYYLESKKTLEFFLKYYLF